jgi:hypothetical protein
LVRESEEGTGQPAIDPRTGVRRRSSRTSWSGLGRYELHLDRKLERMLTMLLRLIPLPDHFECATGSSPLSKYRLPGSDSIQTDLGSVSRTCGWARSRGDLFGKKWLGDPTLALDFTLFID